MVNVRTVIIYVLAIMCVIVIPDAFAHGGFTIPSPNNDSPHKILTVVLGETNEPAFADELHNIEIVLRDSLTSMPITNAYRDGITDKSLPSFRQPQSLWVDAYFFERGMIPAFIGSDCDNITKTKQSPTDTTYDCKGIGHIESSLAQKVRGQHGRPGYYQADYQWYSEPGRTLYHLYGNVNYYNDELIPISVWIDGSYSGESGIRFASNGVDDLGKGFGGFGLKHRADWYWPQNDNYPDSIRGSLADIISKIDQIINQTQN